MADEQEQKQARENHDQTMSRLQRLRDDVKAEITKIINLYYDKSPDDLTYESQERRYIRDDLRRVQRRIDETINDL